jgi:hypothetical protein
MNPSPSSVEPDLFSNEWAVLHAHNPRLPSPVGLRRPSQDGSARKYYAGIAKGSGGTGMPSSDNGSA